MNYTQDISPLAQELLQELESGKTVDRQTFTRRALYYLGRVMPYLQFHSKYEESEDCQLLYLDIRVHKGGFSDLALTCLKKHDIDPNEAYNNVMTIELERFLDDYRSVFQIEEPEDNGIIEDDSYIIFGRGDGNLGFPQLSVFIEYYLVMGIVNDLLYTLNHALVAQVRKLDHRLNAFQRMYDDCEERKANIDFDAYADSFIDLKLSDFETIKTCNTSKTHAFNYIYTIKN